MNQRAGLLFLAKNTGRILLILEEQKWTVPTFSRKQSLLNDAEFLIKEYSPGKILPIELYTSKDKGFEFGTYVCLVEEEFLTTVPKTLSWCDLNFLPNNLHLGIKSTLNNAIIKTKIETVLELNL